MDATAFVPSFVLEPSTLLGKPVFDDRGNEVGTITKAEKLENSVRVEASLKDGVLDLSIGFSVGVAVP